MVAQAAVAGLAVGVGVTTALLLWPVSAWWGWLLLIGAVPAAMAVTWMVVSPVLTALVMDRLVLAVRQESGLPVADGVAVVEALRMLVATLPARLGWLALALVAALLGPVGPLVASYALARTAGLDAFDTALAMEDPAVEFRLAGMQAHAPDRAWGGLVAAPLHLLAAATFLAWWCWMPSLVCGAALRRAGKT
jgi:hypothetical protein